MIPHLLFSSFSLYAYVLCILCAMSLLPIFVFVLLALDLCYFYLLLSLVITTAMFVYYTQSFQWRVSRVVEPQVSQPKEKVYSIASALPRPCYSSLLSQLTNVSVRNEERVAFSQTEHSPLNTAQQLTLLQQVPREQGALFFFTHLALVFLCWSWLCSLS